MSNNKPFYLKFGLHSPFKKREIFIMDKSGVRYIVLNPFCKDSWWRKLLGKSSIAGFCKVKRYHPSLIKRLKIWSKIIHWHMFARDAEFWFYPRTEDATYLKMARMAKIKIIKLKKQLR